jgi:hypothetical protein
VSLRDERDRRWEKERSDREPAIRQLCGHARNLADHLGRPITGADVLAALDDTGLALIRDGEGLVGDACRSGAVFLVIADPLDQEPAIDSHWDVEAEGREAAAERRKRHNRREEGYDE